MVIAAVIETRIARDDVSFVVSIVVGDFRDLRLDRLAEWCSLARGKMYYGIRQVKY